MNRKIGFNLLSAIVGLGLAISGGASAEPPLGILGDVTVQNDTSNPVPVTIESPIAIETRELVEYSCFEQMLNGQGSVSCDFGEMVPEGKVFVMEFFYGRVNQQSNSSGVQFVFNFQNRFRFLPPPTVKTRASSEFSSNAVYQQVQSSIHHSGTDLSTFVFRRSAVGSASVQARISGYLIDAP